MSATFEGRQLSRMLAAGAILLVVCLCAPGALADSGRTVAISAGRIETVSEEPIENGVILIRDGRIETIGSDVEVPDGAEVIDARDGVVFPGLVNAATALGISGAAGGKPDSNPHYRVADELYPFQDAYKLAARAGFTTLALSRPTAGIGGQAALVRTVADGSEEMLLSDRGPLVIDFRADTDTRNAIKGALDGASKSSDAKTAPLRWALQGDIPAIVRCSGAGTVTNALKLLESYKELKPVLACSGSDIYLVADQLGKKEASVITPAAITFERFTRNRISVPRLLADAGAKLALVPSSDGVSGYEDFRQSVAELVRAGLDRETALKAMTLHPAQMLDLEYRLGSLAEGKDANLIVLDGDVLDAGAKVLRVLIEGDTVYDAAWGGLK